MDDPPLSESKQYASSEGHDIEALKTALLGLLCGVLLFLLIFLMINSWPILVNMYRRIFPIEDAKHLERRKQTIRTWTISKVSINAIVVESPQRSMDVIAGIYTFCLHHS